MEVLIVLAGLATLIWLFVIPADQSAHDEMLAKMTPDERSGYRLSVAAEQLKRERAARAAAIEPGEKPRTVKKGRRKTIKWYGRMKCEGCDHQWKSRQQKPPTRCPYCDSEKVEPVEKNSWQAFWRN